MARRFRGESTHKVDAKGRVSIPAAYRRVLEENDPDWTEGLNPNLVIVYGDSRRKFLEGYSMAAMAEVDDRIAAMKRGSPRRRYLERMFSGQAVPMQIDDTGRLVLSPKLRQKVGITNEAYFIASGDTFQIWRPETFEAEASRYDDLFEGMGEDFDPLSLLDSDPGA